MLRLPGVDALAVAVGTVHRMETQGVDLQFDLLRRIRPGGEDSPCDPWLHRRGGPGSAPPDRVRGGEDQHGHHPALVVRQTLREQIEENPKLSIE